MNVKTQDPSSEPLWGVMDVARYLRASKSWVYKAAEKGELPDVRIGRLLRFRPQVIRSYVVARGKRRRIP
jgi:excisionase family DNA binding protein